MLSKLSLIGTPEDTRGAAVLIDFTAVDSHVHDGQAGAQLDIMAPTQHPKLQYWHGMDRINADLRSDELVGILKDDLGLDFDVVLQISCNSVQLRHFASGTPLAPVCPSQVQELLEHLPARTIVSIANTHQGVTLRRSASYSCSCCYVHKPL